MNESGPKKFSVRILTATFLPHFSTSLAQGSVGPLAPFIQKALNISLARIGALTSIQSVGWIVTALAGSLVERSSIRLWISLCPVVTGICSLLFAHISSFSQALIILFFLGFIFSFVNPATTKAILLGFPRVRRGTAIAMKQTGVPAGVFFASVSLPIIAVSAGWEWAMAFVGVVNILLGVFCWFLYREDGGTAGSESFQLWGALRKDFSDLIHNSDFLLISFLQGFFNIGQFTIQSYLVLYLVESVGYSTVYAGFIMAITQFCGIFSRILWGMMSDFIFAGRRVPVLQIIGLTSVAGLIGIAFVNSATPAWVVWAVASMAGAGSLSFTGTAILLRAELAGKELAATSTGMGMSIAAWGVIFGPPLFGLIVDMTQSYKVAWEVIAAVTAGATIMLRFIRERRPAGKAIKCDSCQVQAQPPSSQN